MAVILTDNFTGTEGSDLSAHTADSGHSWTKHPGFTESLLIQSNRAGKDANANTTLYYSSLQVGLEFAVESPIIDVGNVNRACGFGCTSPSVDHGIYVRRQNATTWQLLKIVSGVATSLETAAASFVQDASTLLRFWRIGNFVWWSIAGSPSAGSPFPITDVELSGPSRIAIRASNNHSGTGYHLDNLIVSDFDLGTIARPQFLTE